MIGPRRFRAPVLGLRTCVTSSPRVPEKKNVEHHHDTGEKRLGVPVGRLAPFSSCILIFLVISIITRTTFGFTAFTICP